ncbi:MAG: hypothetical protein V1913_11520 [Fibrobacterota bacterium]
MRRSLKIIYPLFGIICLLGLVRCGKKAPVNVLCLRDNMTLRSSKDVSKKSGLILQQWSQMEWLGDSVADAGGKVYYHIRVMEGVEGYIERESIALNARPGVVKDTLHIFSSQGSKHSTDYRVPPLTIVAVLKETGVYDSVCANDCTMSGWVKASAVYKDPENVQAAFLVLRHRKANLGSISIEVLNEMEQSVDIRKTFVYDYIKSLIASEVEQAVADTAATGMVSPSEEGHDMTEEETGQ